jgi:hypothetical protein
MCSPLFIRRIVAGLLLLGMCACSGAATQTKTPQAAPSSTDAAAQAEPTQTLERGRALTAQFYARKNAELWRELSPKMHATLQNEANLEAFQRRVETDLGAETKLIDEQVTDAPPYRVYVRTTSYSKTEQPVIVQWALAQDGKVADFSIAPKPTMVEGAAAQSVTERGRSLTALFYAGNTGELWGRMSSDMQAALESEQKFAGVRAQVEEQLGTETKLIDEKVATAPPYQVYVRTVSFSKTDKPVFLQWALTTDGKIAGFFIKPGG